MRGLVIRAGIVTCVTCLASAWMGVPSFGAEETPAEEEQFDCATVGRLWEDATRQELADSRLHFRSTKLYFSQQLFARAAREAEIAIHLDPEEAEYYMRAGMAYAELHCFVAAGNAFAGALKLVAGIEKHKNLEENIRNNRAHYWTDRFNQGIGHLEEEELEEAAREFQNAIAVDSTDVRAYRNLGVVYLRLEEYRRALRTFKQALMLEPDDEKTRYNYRRTLSSIAADSFNMGLRLTGVPDSADVGKQMIEDAVQLIDETFEWDPPDEESESYELHRGTCWQALGQVDSDSIQARAKYEEAIRHYRAAAVIRERVRETNGEPPRGIESDPDYLRSLLSCFLAISAYDSTLAYGRMLVDLNPRDPIGYNYVAEAYRGMGQQEQALVNLLMRQALEKGEAVPNINNHFVDLIKHYPAGSDIIKATMSMESPDEIRISEQAGDKFEAWIFWGAGRADCYYNGRLAGTVTFAPLSTPEE